VNPSFVKRSQGGADGVKTTFTLAVQEVETRLIVLNEEMGASEDKKTIVILTKLINGQKISKSLGTPKNKTHM